MPEYFTLAELRALPDMSNVTRYTDARCEAAAAYIVAVVEREVGASFVARTVTAEIHDGGVDGIVLRKPHVISATSATENGVTVTDTLSVRAGVLERRATGAYSSTTWATGTRNISVTYSAGYSTVVPADVKEAALQGTRYRLLAVDGKSGVSDRASSISNEFGNVNLVIAGEGRPTGLPEVDAVILGWKKRLDNFGFA